MFGEELKNIKITEKKISDFGVLLNLICVALSLMFYFKEENFFWYFIVAAVLADAFLLFIPAALKPVYKIWMSIAVIIGFLMAKILLGALFFAGLTPIAALKKIFGKEFLHLKFDKEASTYWVKKCAGNNPKKQF